MSFKVQIQVLSPETSETYEIVFRRDQIFTIGRKDCDLVLDDPKISKNHLSLKMDEGAIRAEDMGSRNGTTIDGNRIQSQIILPGESLFLGKHTIRLVSVTEVKSGAKVPPPKPDETPPKEVTKTGTFVTGFRFYPGKKIAFEPIKETYLYAFKNWKIFWETTSYSIPFNESIRVLIALSLCYAVFLGLFTKGKVGIGFTFLFLVLTVGFPLAGAVIFSELKGWLKASGDFDSYVAYSVYWYFLYFPFSVALPFLGGLGSVFGLLLMFWSTRGFVHVFQPDLKRFILLWLGVSFAFVFLAGAMVFRIMSIA